MTALSGTIQTLETILDLSVHLEAKGKAFYEQAMVTADSRLKSLLNILAEQEGRHLETYKRLAERVSGQAVYQEAMFGEYGMYIDLLVSELTEKMEYSPSFGVAALMDMAVRFEKDTLLFFMEIKGLFTGEDLETIEAICNEEKKHIQLLLEFMAGRDHQV